MTTIGLGVFMFTFVVLSLVLLLLAARSKLVSSGDVTIVINEDASKAVHAKSGDTLLSTLAAQQIFIPSACGGKGTCATCKIRIDRGGGATLPTETPHLSARERRHGVRLSCQVKVKDDMEIHIPEDVFGVSKWTCRVRSNRNVATFIKELVLELPEGEEVPFRAGGYIQIECPPYEARFADFEIGAEYRGDWEKHGLLDLVSRVDEPVTRAYSMANYPGERGIIMLNIRIATPPPRAPSGTPPGKMSSYVFNLQPGDEVTISGPYGEFFARETEAEMVFIGGGAGMAPMRSHILDQLLRLKAGRKISFWYGARSLREAFYVEEFDRLAEEHENFEWRLVLSEPLPEDEWEGPSGFVHQAVLDLYLSKHAAPEDIEYYLCGPPLMIAACKSTLSDLGVEPDNVMFDEF